MAQTMRADAGRARQQGPVGNFFEIEPRWLADIQRRMALVRPDASVPAQLRPMMQLFEVLRAGGSFGLGYEAQGRRSPRRPNDVLSIGRGDCDELSMTFLAAARALGINAAFTLSRFELSDASRTVAHGPLAVTIGGRRFIVDPILKRTKEVRDFSDSTMRVEIAPELGLAGGNNAAAATRVALANRTDMSADSDIAAAGYFEMAQHRAPAGRAPVTIAALDEAFGLLESGVRCGPANRTAVAMGGDVAKTIFARYYDLAKAAYARRDYRGAERFYLRALEVRRLVPAVDGGNRDAVYRANMTLGLMYSASRRHSDAAARFAESRRLRPEARENYDSGIRALDILASNPRNPDRLLRAREGLALSAEAKARFGTAPALRRAYERAERHFQWIIQRLSPARPPPSSN